MSDVKLIAKSSAEMFQERMLESVATGFYFAAAVAWMDVVRAVLTKTVKIKNNSQSFFLITAAVTTLISALVSIVISKIDKNVKAAKPVYAVM
jgi:hypothetical protein